MFGVTEDQSLSRRFRLAIVVFLVLSIMALVGTAYVMIEFLREQEIVADLLTRVPSEAIPETEELAGELRWQFRLTLLILPNFMATAIATALLWRAYQSSQRDLRDVKVLAGHILGSMEQAILTTSERGTVTSVNARGHEMLETDSTIVGQAVQLLSAAIPLDAICQELLEHDDRLIERDFPMTREGSQRIWRVLCQPLKDHDLVTIGCIVQILDVTERQLMDDRMRRMERYLGLGSLVAGLHHEIKNPLSALSLHVQLLEEEFERQPVTADITEMLSVIRLEVARVIQVLESFRDYASLSDLNAHPLDLLPVIAQQLRLIRPQADRQQVRTSVETAGPEFAPRIVADRTRLEQVLLNLFINALEAMPDGGRLTVRVSQSDELLKIEVCDDGPGIPEDLRSMIFDPYFTTKSEGTGMGLALCEKIVRQHQGSLEYRRNGRESVFEILLPLEGVREQLEDKPGNPVSEQDPDRTEFATREHESI